MTITTMDGLVGATKYQIVWMKTGTRTLVAASAYNLDGVTGMPTGTLAIGNTANGVVPTDDGSYGPVLPSFGSTPYISRIVYGSTVACTMILYDRLWAAGAYAYNTDTTLASQPDFDGRVINTSMPMDLWFEAVTAFTGTPSVQVNYLDQDGNAGDTGAIASPVTTPPIGRMFRVPLAAGDTGIYGVDGITRIRGSVASAGTFNVSVMRPLAVLRVPAANSYSTMDFLSTGLVRIFPTSCLWVTYLADSTAVGLPYMMIEVADG